MNYTFHRLAEMFPPMSAEEFDGLKRSIKEHGLREAIWTINGNQIIDGRNRYLACVEVGVVPEFREYTGDDPFRFVVDQNINRRHLDTAQRALIAAGMANITNGQVGGGHGKQVDEFVHLISNEEAAHLLNVGTTAVKEAKRILNSGRQDIIDQVRSGGLSVHGAAKMLQPAEKRDGGVRKKKDKFPSEPLPSSPAMHKDNAGESVSPSPAADIFDGEQSEIQKVRSAVGDLVKIQAEKSGELFYTDFMKQAHSDYFVARAVRKLHAELRSHTEIKTAVQRADEEIRKAEDEMLQAITQRLVEIGNAAMRSFHQQIDNNPLLISNDPRIGKLLTRALDEGSEPSERMIAINILKKMV